MKKTTNINWAEKIPEVSKQIKEFKITSFYMLSTDLYKIDNKKLTKIITDKFENHPATIMILIGTKDNQLLTKKHNFWNIPSDLHHLKGEIDKKTNDYLDLYFTKLEKEKQNWLFNVESTSETIHTYSEKLDLLPIDNQTAVIIENKQFPVIG